MPSDRAWETPPTFQVDLDVPAEHRWHHVVSQYLPLLSDLVSYIKEVEASEYGTTLAMILRRSAALVSGLYMNRELRKELQGIARDAAGVGLTYDMLLVMNMGYDLLARCTSAVVACPRGGGPVHLRNMDWDAEAFWPLTIDVEFCRAGRVVFKGTSWVGFVGLQTGMRMDAWSVSLNFRQVQGPSAIIGNILAYGCGAWPISFLVRCSLQECADFETAVRRLRRARLMAPCYLTLAGSAPGQGVVLERRRWRLDRCQSLDAVWAAGHPRWELARGVCVVSNLDCCRQDFDFTEGSPDVLWAEGDALLLTALQRRTTALSLIGKWTSSAAIEQEASLQEAGGFAVLGAAPVCNDQTVYSCVLRPSESVYASRVILKWEEYSRGIDADAWESYQRTSAFRATKAMQLINDRGEHWPEQRTSGTTR